MHPLKTAKLLLKEMRGKELSSKQRIDKTIELAALLLEATEKEKTIKEKKQEKWMARMVGDPEARLFITALTDQCYRSHSNKRTADQMIHLIKTFGTPQFLPEEERIKFLLFRIAGKLFPNLFIPQIKKQIKKELSAVLLPEDQKSYFERCKKEHIRLNINHLGEAILGEPEAERRLQVYLNDLDNPYVDYVSVKISTIYSQINMVGWEATLEALAEKLRKLYRKGQEKNKFVNLDMEESHDLDLTVALFQKVLDEPEFYGYHAGLVLQSYLPNAFAIQQQLTEWAVKRIDNGGAPIRLRLVKGANLALEEVESSVRGWTQAPYDEKVQSDANIKRMLEYASCKTRAVKIGLGSHNIFDIAYTLLLRAERTCEKEMSFEMLQGMADPLQRVVRQLTGGVLLYCPEAQEKDFQNAIPYLIRRLDENSGQQNFLRHFFELKPGNRAWEEQVERFKAAVTIENLSSTRKRRQDRREEIDSLPLDAPFVNEPDTDFSLPENRLWLDTIFSDRVSAHQHPFATQAEIEKMLGLAKEATWEKRDEALAQAAHIFRQKRGVLMSAMIHEGKKTAWEADPEISEAIDFIDYYRKQWKRFTAMEELTWSPKGTVLVAPPWNFPCSIPVGGIAAALTAGNSVIFKPAPETVQIGWEVVNCFWEAGVPKDVLQFLRCADEPEGSALISHPLLDSVILTGATATARHFMRLRPDLDLHAETGGKNALIVTAMSDRDLAIRDLIQSAFGHNGQKCSACSLAILEAEVYDDPRFQRQLKEAAMSLTVAPSSNRSAKITPLIHPPEEALLRGLTTLEKGESWLLEPQQDRDDPSLWSPGIKYGVKPGSFMHQTELFGPVLGVMRAENLDEAIELANATPYGLTSGIHTLDEREQNTWKSAIEAGNLYINRGITGAIVRRQPFGGCKASSFGRGAKAGGPNYVAQLATPTAVTLPQEKAPLPPQVAPMITSLKSCGLDEKSLEIWKKSAENYAYWAPILKEPTDPSCVLGQDNYFYHVPRKRVFLRVDVDAPILPVLQVMAACLICGTPLEISSASQLAVTTIVEEEEAFVRRLPEGARVRLISSPSQRLLKEGADQGIYVDAAPVLPHGRLELLHYLREVSLSVDYHRYGYMGLRFQKSGGVVS